MGFLAHAALRVTGWLEPLVGGWDWWLSNVEGPALEYCFLHHPDEWQVVDE